MIGKLHMPAMPTLPTREEIRQRAKAMFAKTVSLEDIVDHAHRMILDAAGGYRGTEVPA
jgi:stearoyl-CoA desaturase (delta-9 desaturase)